MANNIDIVKEFLVESYEGLNRVDNDLLALELDPDNREKLASVFRAIHTIKGSCSFLEFPKLESLAHAGESLLALLRDGKKTLSIDIITVLLTMVDAIREILGRIEATMQEGEAAYPNLIGELRRHCEGESGGMTGLNVSMAAVAGREHAAAESGSGDSLSPDRVLASSVAGRSSSGPGADTPNPRDGLMQDFLAETRANMAQLEADLVLFERGGVNEEKLDGTYRIVHTLRGSSQLVGLAGLAEVAGAGEDLMKRLRSGQIPMDPESIGALHLFADAVRRLVEHFAQSGVEDAAGSGGIVEMLHSVHREPERAAAGAIAGGAPGADREMVCSFLDHAEECLIAIDRILEEISCSGPDESSAEKALHEMGRLNRLAGCMEYEELEDVTRAIVKKMERFDRDGELLDDSTRDALGGVVVEARRILASIGKAVGLAEKSQQAPVSEKNEAPRVSSAPTEKTFVKRETIQDVPVAEMSSRPSRSSGVSDSTIRVDVRLLDELMNLVGELVLARNQLMQRTTGADDSGLAHCTQRLNYLTSELQEHVMKTRMQPVGNVWSKFPRVVRDLAINCGKRVRLEMHGGETELDKTLIEAINDPLIHLVRNCVDHGIGLPQERIEAGKPEEGSLVLRAYHESGQVNIEVSDDGRGIDLQRLRQKAVERNLISTERARTMNDREAMNLIFLPGLTTAEEVTNVSGRGVGMDIVRTRIEGIGGSVDVQSVLGMGTTIRVKVPLTLAIIPALIIRSGAERYAIPQVNLLELVRLKGEEARAGIEMLHGAPVHRLRGKLLPLVFLSLELRGESYVHPARSRSAREVGTLNIVVLQAGDRKFGLVVDGIHDTQEIVVKPLGKQIKDIPILAGATIMGDGKIALIIDVVGLAQRAHVITGSGESAADAEEDAEGNGFDEARQVLLVRGADGARMGIHLSNVIRLERLPLAGIERIGRRYAVQYRGEIMSLADTETEPVDTHGSPPYLDRILAEEGDRRKEQTDVVVCSSNNRNIGLVVDKILDVAYQPIEVQGESTRPGVSGTAVIQNLITELLDVDYFIASVAAHAGIPNEDADV